jgi:ketosteroid isomerase-like protein
VAAARVEPGRARVPGACARGRYIEDWLSTFDGVRLDLEDPAEIAGRVVADVHGHGRGRASGLETETRFCQVWTLRSGTAVRMDEYATREQALTALESP